MANEPTKPSMNSRTVSIRGVLRPLLYLIIPALIFGITYFLPKFITHWIQIGCAALAGLILLWFLFRLTLYIIERIKLAKQNRMLQYQDPDYIAASKIKSRFARVLGALDSMQIDKYSLPWFLMLGGSAPDTEHFFENSGVNFIEDIEGLPADEKGHFEQWKFSEQALFINLVDNRFHEPGQLPWETFFDTLVHAKQRAPINGLVIQLPVEYFSGQDENSRAGTDRALLKKLRSLQHALKTNFPVYLTVSGINRLVGCQEFFESLGPDEQEKIFGISLDPLTDAFDSGLIAKQIDRFKNKVEQYMLHSLALRTDAVANDLLYLFKEQIDTLADAVNQTAGALFKPSLHLDPVLFGGFFFTSGAPGEKRQVFGLQGPLRAVSMPATSKVQTDSTDSGQLFFEGMTDSTPLKSLFIKDLVQTKIFPEQGKISYAPSIIKIQNRYRIGTAILLLMALVFSVGWIVASSINARKWVAEVMPEVQLANDQVPATQDLTKILEHLNELISDWNDIKTRQVMNKYLERERYAEMTHRLQSVHYSIFEHKVLEELFVLFEDRLENWNGQGRFDLYSKALIEYVRWANPKTRNSKSLKIAPIVEFLEISEPQRSWIIENFAYYLSYAPPSHSLVGTKGEGLIGKALDEINKYFNPGIAELANAGSWYGDSIWWFQLSEYLTRIDDNFKLLLSITPPDATGNYDQVQNHYVAFMDTLAKLDDLLTKVDSSLKLGMANRTGWISVDDFYTNLGDAGKGWSLVETNIAKSKDSSKNYEPKIQEPIENLLYLVQLFADQTGGMELIETLINSGNTKAKMIFQSHAMVGRHVRTLISSMATYQKQLTKMSEGYDSWRLDLINHHEFLAAIPKLRMVATHMSGAAQNIEASRFKISSMFGKQADPGKDPKKKDDEKGISKVFAGVEKMEKNVTKLVPQYSWDKLDTWSSGWEKVLTLEAVNQQARYWTELVDLFDPATGFESSSWSALKGARPFQANETLMFSQPSEIFLTDWISEIPKKLKDLTDPANADNVNSLALTDFVSLYGDIQKFNETYFPAMRQASKQFINCVHEMNQSASSAWTKLWPTQGPGKDDATVAVSWAALESFTTFKANIDKNLGKVLTSITLPLVHMQESVIGVFEAQLEMEFENLWGGIIADAKTNEINKRFPFIETMDPTAGYTQTEQFFQQLQMANNDFILLANTTDGKTPVYSRTIETRDRIITTDQKNFLKRSLTFYQFLKGDDKTKPRKMVFAFVSGKYGEQFHWLRLLFGDGAFYDLNVYGKEPVTVPIMPGIKSVSYQGLDVTKSPKVSNLVAQGDFALLQLLYFNGTKTDSTRKNWKVLGQLPSDKPPANQVSFEYAVTLEEPLPELPNWPLKTADSIKKATD